MLPRLTLAPKPYVKGTTPLSLMSLLNSVRVHPACLLASYAVYPVSPALAGVASDTRAHTGKLHHPPPVATRS